MTAGVLDFRAIARRMKQLDTWGNWKEPTAPGAEVKANPKGYSLDDFSSAGYSWKVHVPGNPMPVPGEAEVYVFLRQGCVGGPDKASMWNWKRLPPISYKHEIIGWRYA